MFNALSAAFLSNIFLQVFLTLTELSGRVITINPLRTTMN